MRRTRPRRGVTLLEVQVALIVLGITLAGICPILIVQSKLLRKFESRAADAKNFQVILGQRMPDGATVPVTILQPQPDSWIRRLGISATFAEKADPQTYSTPTDMTVRNLVTIQPARGTDPLAPSGGAATRIKVVKMGPRP